MAYYERLPTRLNPLAERTCFSQVHVAGPTGVASPDIDGLYLDDGWSDDAAPPPPHGVIVGLYPIVTFQYSSTTLYHLYGVF